MNTNWPRRDFVNLFLHDEVIVNLLFPNSVFDFAFKLSIKLDLSINKILDELVNKYVFCVMNPSSLEELFVEIQNWFTENETAALTYSSTNLIDKMWLINKTSTHHEVRKAEADAHPQTPSTWG